MLFVGGSCGYTFSLNKKIHFGFQCSTRCIEKQGTYSFCQRGISNISTERRIWLKFPLPKRIHSGFQCIARFIDKWPTDFLCQRWISIISRERWLRLKLPWNKIGHAVFRVPRPRRVWLQFSLNKKIHFGFQCSTRCIEKQGTDSLCQRGISNISRERRIWLKFPLPKKIQFGFQCIARFHKPRSSA